MYKEGLLKEWHSEILEHRRGNGCSDLNLFNNFDNKLQKIRMISKDNKLKKYAMIVICAKKWGLIANATRLVHFGSIPAELENRYENLIKVEKSFLEHTKVDTNLKEIFKKGINSYKNNGYPEEWKKHHQGGITGYSPREIIADANSEYKTKIYNVFAWNPSISGTKIEDTYILGKDGLEYITETGEWDYTKVKIDGKSIKRPKILMKNDYY